MNKEFWDWVNSLDGSLKGSDDPRGDFIRDTQKIMSKGLNPDDVLRNACTEALAEYEQLCREWEEIQRNRQDS